MQLLIGQPAAEWLESEQVMNEGFVTDDQPGDMLEGYVVEWRDGSRTQMTTDQAQKACSLGRYLRARDGDTESVLKARFRNAIRMKAKRDEQRASVNAAAADGESDGDNGIVDEEGHGESALSEEEERWMRRSLSRANMFNTVWWVGMGNMGVRLHNHMDRSGSGTNHARTELVLEGSRSGWIQNRAWYGFDGRWHLACTGGPVTGPLLGTI